MKRMIAIICLALMSFSFMSCGKTGKIESLTDINMPTLVDSRPKEEKKVTFKTLNGDEVEYNRNTRKILCVFGSHDVVSFGIRLLAYEGTTDIKGFEPFYEGAKKLVNNAPISPEEILSYHPELILTHQRISRSTIKVLEKIAPVIPLYTDSNDFKERLTYLGRIFDLPGHADTLISYADNLERSMKNELQSLGLANKTLTIFTYYGSGISIPPERGWFMNTILYQYLGLKRLDNVIKFMRDESVIAYQAISSESLIDYEGDLVIYAAVGEKIISSYVSENPGWKRLKAVMDGRVGIINIDAYAQKGVILLYAQYLQIYEALKVSKGR